MPTVQAHNALLLIGVGRMGGALAEGWFTQGIRPITLVEPDDAVRAHWQAKGIKSYATLEQCPRDLSADTVILAIKPPHVAPLLEQCRGRFARNTVFLSMAAGVSTATMRQALADARAIIRCMPNLPAMVGEGIFGAFADSCSDAQRAATHNLLTVLGPVVWLEQETQMDALTALSGSGPAYVFHLIEAMEEGGVALGLPKNQARLLALQTVKGAALLAAQSNHSAAELRAQVTSPNGTTQAAFEVLLQEPHSLASLLKDAMAAAARRSKEMAG